MNEIGIEPRGFPTYRFSGQRGRLFCERGGRVLEVDEGLLTLLGYPDQETFLREVPRVQHLSGKPLTQAPGAQELLEGRSPERRWLRQDGTSVWVWIEAWMEAGDRVAVRVEDVTSRQHLEAQLRESQRLALMGQLCAGISHDLNNFLTAILAHADLAVDLARTEDQDELEESLVQIRAAAERGSTMIRQMLNFGKGARLILRPIDLGVVVESALRLNRPLLPTGVTIQVTQAGSCWVRADCGAMEQVLVNLVLNARDALPKGGEIRIDIREGQLSETVCAQQGWGDPGRYGVLTVTDNGAGMSPECVEQAFVPFMSTKDPSQGSGLGLPTVYSLIKQHRGYITIDSQPDRGTTIQVYLRLVSRRFLTMPPGWPPPTLEDAPAADLTGPRHHSREMELRAPAYGSPGAGGARILLVEDNKPLLELMARILRSRGFLVATEADGEAVLARLGNGVPPPDVMITDFRLPGVTGLDLAEAVWRTGAPTQVLLTSGIQIDWDDGRFGGQEPDDTRPPLPAFLPKPWSGEDLLAAVTQLVERGGESDSRRPGAIQAPGRGV